MSSAFLDGRWRDLNTLADNALTTMRRTKQMIAVVMVATALCADRAVAAAPQAPVPARSLASRITTMLRRTVAPSVRLQPARTSEKIRSFALPIRETASGVRPHLSAFQLPLPPPAR
jgi:hypothetical protein